MDLQDRGGSTGSAGVAGASETNVARRERLRKLAMEVIDLDKDPYFMKNHLGTYECKLCLTLHTNEGSYLAHTQGKKHQANLARRAAKDAADASGGPSIAALRQQAAAPPSVPKRVVAKIGLPVYKIVQLYDKETDEHGFCIQVILPKLLPDVQPLHRFMSAFEQHKEAPDRRFQYLLVAAEPYETIAVRLPARELHLQDDARYLRLWDAATKTWTLQCFFRRDGGVEFE